MQDDRKRQARAAWKRRQARKREREACAGNGEGKQFKKQGRVTMICNWRPCHKLELAPAKGLPRCAAISSGKKGRRLRCRRPPGRSKRSERLRFRFPATITLLRRGRSPRPTVCRRCSSRSATSGSSSTAFHMTWCADGGGRWDLTRQRRGCWRRIWMCMRRNVWQRARRPLSQ